MEAGKQENSSDNAMNEYRVRRRELLKEKREFNRSKAFDLNRFVESEIVTEKDIAGLCSRIKRRKHATDEDLRKLCNAFIQSEANISAFIKTTGAINVVIKEFTGSDRSQQLLAAQCLCNLSLGDETCCAKIATFAGSYLMIFIMKSNDISLARICLWTTQNIVAAGAKAMAILLAQELFMNCLHILNNSVENEVEAMQLLDLLIGNKWHACLRLRHDPLHPFSDDDDKWRALEADENKAIQQSVFQVLKKRSDNQVALQVFYKTTKLNCGWSLSQEETEVLVLMLAGNLHSAKPTSEDTLCFIIKLLMLSFLHDPNNIVVYCRFLCENEYKLSALINIVTSTPKYFNILKDLLHFTAFIYTSQHPTVAQFVTADPLDNFKVPKLFEF